MNVLALKLSYRRLEYTLKMRLSGNIPDSKAVIRNTGLLSSGVSRADQVSQNFYCR